MVASRAHVFAEVIATLGLALVSFALVRVGPATAAQVVVPHDSAPA